MDVVEFLLDTLEDVKVDAVDNEGQTALFHASMGGHAAVVRRLVETGATIDKRNKVTNNYSFKLNLIIHLTFPPFHTNLIESNSCISISWSILLRTL